MSLITARSFSSSSSLFTRFETHLLSNAPRIFLGAQLNFSIQKRGVADEKAVRTRMRSVQAIQKVCVKFVSSMSLSCYTAYLMVVDY